MHHFIPEISNFHSHSHSYSHTCTHATTSIQRADVQSVSRGKTKQHQPISACLFGELNNGEHRNVFIYDGKKCRFIYSNSCINGNVMCIFFVWARVCSCQFSLFIFFILSIFGACVSRSFFSKEFSIQNKSKRYKHQAHTPANMHAYKLNSNTFSTKLYAKIFILVLSRRAFYVKSLSMGAYLKRSWKCELLSLSAFKYIAYSICRFLGWWNCVLVCSNALLHFLPFSIFSPKKNNKHTHTRSYTEFTCFMEVSLHTSIWCVWQAFYA